MTLLNVFALFLLGLLEGANTDLALVLVDFFTGNRADESCLSKAFLVALGYLSLFLYFSFFPFTSLLTIKPFLFSLYIQLILFFSFLLSLFFQF